MIFLGVSTPLDSRPDPVQRLYATLADVNDAVDGPRYLRNATGSLDWPDRGVYFFFSSDSDLESAPARDWHLTRVGTVGVSEGSSNTLWNRLRQHRGNFRGKYAGGGNHRGSIFRLHVGRALIERDNLHDDYHHWGTPLRDLDVETTTIREQEHPLEQRVSDYIRDLPFLWVNIPDEPGPESDRATVEKNAIATLSHFRRTNPDLYKDGWLGHESPKPEIYKTGLWNINHVEALYSQHVVDLISEYAEKTQPLSEE
ncbi:hypothetical protein [Halorussus sp. AFM4]|uniref:hypothetical protein n=1 Tax=Halorussus sp. AFM4 TaxID=3421651 RepID=UPI003EBE23A4